MGYVLNKLANLPIDDNVSFYIFVVNGRYRDPLYEILEKNFRQIAKDIGDNAVIATGTENEAFTTSVARTYLGKDNSDSSFLEFLPALIITNDHPDRLRKESMRLIVPLRDAEARFGGWHQFFSSLAEFARGESDAFAKRFDEKDNLLDAANKIVNLKPGAFGVGLNINELIDRWNKSRRARRASR